MILAGLSFCRAALLALSLAGIFQTLRTTENLASREPVSVAAANLLAGHVTSPSTLAALVHHAGTMDCRSDQLINRAMLLVQATEQFLLLGQLRDFDTSIDEAREDISRAISCTPSSSSGWLMLFWESSLSGGHSGPSFQYLQRSYDLGPNEGWLSLLRMRLAASFLDGLPQSVQDVTVAEFISLVRSGFVEEAAKVYFMSGNVAQSLFDKGIESLPNAAARELEGKVQELMSISLTIALGEAKREFRSSPAR